MTEREREWDAYQTWKKDFRGPIYFQSWEQWIAEYGFAAWQASRRAALEEIAKGFEAEHGRTRDHNYWLVAASMVRALSSEQKK